MTSSGTGFNSTSRTLRCVFAHDHPFILCNGKFASRAGFPESVLQRYADAFGQVDILCRAKTVNSTALQPIVDTRLHFHPLANLRSLQALSNFPRVQKEVRRIVAGADCVVARLPSAVGLLAAHEALRQKKPLLVEIVGNAFEANVHHGSRIGLLAAPIEHLLCKSVVRRAPAVVYITERYLQRIYPTRGRAFVCPNVEIVETIPRPPAFPTASPGKGLWTLGLVGSLDVDYKGHGVAIVALARLRARFPDADIRLQFVGSGNPERWRNRAVAAGVAEHVEFLGSLAPGAEVRAWHDMIDIALQPSRVEAQGRSIIEAMSRGRPVLAGAVGGIPEVVSAACLVDPDDADALADKVAALMLDPDHYAATARDNLQRSRAFLKPTVEARRAEAFSFLRQQTSLPR